MVLHPEDTVSKSVAKPFKMADFDVQQPFQPMEGIDTLSVQATTSEEALKQSQHVAILDNLVQHVSVNPNVDVRLLARNTKHPFVHVSHRNWENCTDISFVPTFYVISRIVRNNKGGIVGSDEEVLQLQLVAFNGKRLLALAEEYSLQHDIAIMVQHSQLLCHFVRGEIGLCKGLTKTDRSLNDANALRETLEEDVIYRSTKCLFAVLKFDSQTCNECSNHVGHFDVPSSSEKMSPPPSATLFPKVDPVEILEQIKNETNTLDSDVDVDDAYLDEMFCNEEGQFENLIRKPVVNFEDRLTKLKCITIAKASEGEEESRILSAPSESTSTATCDNVKTEQNMQSILEPQINLTVLVQDGDEKKELNFLELRENLDIESERAKIREPARLSALARKRKRAAAAAAAAAAGSRPSNELSQSERRHKKIMSKQQMQYAQAESGAAIVEGLTKKCPVCDKPFSDITDFMAHLSSCDFNNDNNVGGGGNSSGDDATYDPRLDNCDIKQEVVEDDGGHYAFEDIKPFITPRPKRPKKKRPSPSSKKKEPDVTSTGTGTGTGSGGTLVSLECTVCMTSFKHEASYPPHIKAHADKIDVQAFINCPECHLEVSRKDLNPHLKDHHPDKGGCCIECLEFMPVNLLKSHLSRKHHHAPEREGQLCPICGKKCYYTADLEIHIAVQHMGVAMERPAKDEGEVMCHECGKVWICCP